MTAACGRSQGEAAGLGTVWAGAGTNTPSDSQLDLIMELKPTIWAGMGSYGIHLANLADVARQVWG